MAVRLWLAIPLFLMMCTLVFSQEAETEEKRVSPPKETKTDEKPTIQPLQQLIQSVLGLKKRSETEDSTSADDQNLPPRDAVDLRAPLIREQEALLNSAETRVERGQVSEALEIYQTILNEESESVVLGSDGKFQSIRWETQQRIGKLPAESRLLYERTYGPLAKSMLAEANARSDFDAVREIAERYFHTQAGYSAANLVAAHHLDHGEFAIAARWYRRLEHSNAEFVNDPLWRFKVGETYRQAAFSEDDLEDWLAFSSDQQLELSRKLPGKNPEEARDEWKKIVSQYQRPLQDWLFPGGNSNRAAHVQGTAPLLISHWEHTLTDHTDILSQVTELLSDLQLNRVPTIPMMQPIVVGNRVIFRTFDGLRVVDTQTGEMIWESQEVLSPAALLTGGRPRNRPLQHSNVLVNGFPFGQYQGNSAEQHPITNLLFRNSVHGNLSSDGERVYVIERNAILSNSPPGNYYANANPNQNDPYRRDWSSNRLTAYDLKSGQQVWHLGGQKMAEPIASPLSGTFFFGPPLCDSGELFLIGEQDNALRLFCIAGDSGALKWSQLLAFTDVPIDRDLARRWWATSVSLSEGILICPTNVGFLAGIDRRSREILWISRYSEREQEQQSRPSPFRSGGVNVTGPGELSKRWFPTPPMIIGQTVVHAPSEESLLIGYRLTDGQERWRIRGEQEGLFPLGSYNSELIVVTQEALQAYHIETGKLAWKVNYSDFEPESETGGVLPCGRGLIMGDQLLLPMNERELWYFDLVNRQFTHRAEVSREDQKLGNLTMAHGNLIVSHPLGVSLFQPKKDVEEEIQRLLADNPRDPWAMMKQAQMQVLEHEYPAALAALRQVDQQQLGEVQKTQFNDQMLATLFGMVKHEPLQFDAEFEELSRLVESPEDRQMYLRLLADRMLARKDLAAAFKAYAELAGFDGSEQIRDFSDTSLSVRQDVWLQARLKELWQMSTGNVSSNISDSVQQAVRTALDSEDLSQMLKVIRLYGFHPEIEEIYLEMVDLAVEEQNFVIAEYALNSMSQLGDESVAATAIARRASLLKQFGLNTDAAYYAQQLTGYDPNLVLLDGWTVGEWLKEVGDKFVQEATLQLPQELSWAGSEFEITPIGTSSWSNQPGTVNLEESAVPYYAEHRFLFDQRTGRLEIFHRLTDQLVWSIPLQQMDQVAQSNVIPARLDGHLLTVYYRGIVQCYSLPDQKLVWSRAVTSQVGVANQLQTSKQRLPRLQQARYAASRFRLNQFTNEFGPLAIATSHTLCYFGRNELIAVDPLNGEIRWVRRNLPRGTSVYGDGEVLCLVPPNSKDTILVKTSDGRLIESQEIDQLINAGIAIHGHQIISVQNGSTQRILGIQEGDILLTAEDLLTRETLWEVPVGLNDHIGLLDKNTLMIVEKEGAIMLIDLASGLTSLTTHLDPKVVRGQKELFAFAEGDQVFVIANHSTSHSTYMSVHSQRVNGYVAAFARSSGEELWVNKVSALNLVLENLQQMPVLVFGGSKHERRHNLFVGIFNVMIIDKLTGEILIEDSLLTQNQVQQITWSAARKQLRMHAYNSIYTMQPVKAKTLKSDAAKKPAKLE